MQLVRLKINRSAALIKMYLMYFYVFYVLLLLLLCG